MRLERSAFRSRLTTRTCSTHAAHNPEITHAQISEPALTDLLGYKADKRQSGWPTLSEKFQGAERERVYANAPYFDGAHFATRVKCPVRFMVGFTVNIIVAGCYTFL